MYFAHFLLTRVPIFHAAVTPVPLGDEVQRQWVIIQKMRSGFDQKLPQTSSILNPASGASVALWTQNLGIPMAWKLEGNLVMAQDGQKLTDFYILKFVMDQRRWVEKPLHPTEGKEVLWLGWIDKPPPITTNSTLSTIWWCYTGSNVYSLALVDHHHMDCLQVHKMFMRWYWGVSSSITLLAGSWLVPNLWILCVNKLKSTNIHYVRNIRDCKSIMCKGVLFTQPGWGLCGHLGV